MEFAIPHQTLTDDLVHQRDRLCDAVRHSIQQDTDMAIISKDKRLIPFHSSLLVLFSPLFARLLSEVPCCASPSIILPDFPALHIRKLLQILGCGQTIPGENLNADIKIVDEIAQVLQISITDLNVGTYLDNPFNVKFEIKQEANSFKVKQEIISAEEEKVEASNLKLDMNSSNIKVEIISIKEEVIEQFEYIEKGENIPKQEYVVESDKLHDDGNNFHNSVQSIQNEALEMSAFDKEDSHKNKEKSMEQCEYIVTVKIPQQENLLQTQADMLPPMEQVVQLDTFDRELRSSGIPEAARVCQFFLRARCQRQNCEFLHPKGEWERERKKVRERDRERENERGRERDRDTRLYDRPLVPPNIDAPCKYFLGSGCKFGLTCRFNHDTEKRRPRERSREGSRERKRVRKNDSDGDSILKGGASSDGEDVKKKIADLTNIPGTDNKVVPDARVPGAPLEPTDTVMLKPKHPVLLFNELMGRPWSTK